MDEGASESLTLQAWLENSASIGNSNEGDGGDHADSGPVSSTGQTHWLYRVTETPQEELREHVSVTCEAGEGGESPRSELPKGFYEVEAIRSQWMREDIQTENLIKWLDRPNAANSWDPLKNLRNMPDLNDAFEESIRSANQSRCRDKQGYQNTLPQWLQRSIIPCSLRGLSTSGTDNQQQCASPADVDHADIAALPQDTDDVAALPQDIDLPSFTARETINSNEKISMAAPTVGIFNDSQWQFKQLHIFGNSNDNSAFCGPSMVNGIEPVQNERPRGAKKRKSGPVKRFIKVPLEFEPVEQASAAVADSGDNYGDINLETVDENNLDIVRIIRPIDYVSPHETTNRKSFIMFLALRSNGAETLVSNNDLRESNPKLLFKYYEQNLLAP